MPAGPADWAMRAASADCRWILSGLSGQAGLVREKSDDQQPMVAFKGDVVVEFMYTKYRLAPQPARARSGDLLTPARSVA